MTREKAKEICEIIGTHGIEVIKAYAEGKVIQHLNLDGEWIDCDMPVSFVNNHSFRVKPDCCEKLENDLESQDLENKDFVYDYNNQRTRSYRPFKDCNELIEHYQKKYESAVGCDIYFPSLYKPNIWVKSKHCGDCQLLITGFTLDDEGIPNVWLTDSWITLEKLFDDWLFLDNSPCGVEE